MQSLKPEQNELQYINRGPSCMLVVTNRRVVRRKQRERIGRHSSQKGGVIDVSEVGAFFRKRDGLIRPNVTAHREERIRHPGVISILLILSCKGSGRREPGIHSE
jgi:hypothetical protein